MIYEHQLFAEFNEINKLKLKKRGVYRNEEDKIETEDLNCQKSIIKNIHYRGSQETIQDLKIS